MSIIIIFMALYFIYFISLLSFLMHQDLMQLLEPRDTPWVVLLLLGPGGAGVAQSLVSFRAAPPCPVQPLLAPAPRQLALSGKHTHALSSAHWHQEKVLTCHWAHQLFAIWPVPLASLPPPPGWHRSRFHFLSSARALLCPRSPHSHDPTPPSSQIPTLASKHVTKDGLFLDAVPPAARCRQAPRGPQYPGSTLATSGSG